MRVELGLAVNKRQEPFLLPTTTSVTTLDRSDVPGGNWTGCQHLVLD